MANFKAGKFLEKYSPWFGVLGLLVGIIGTLATVLIYNHTRDDATIVFTRRLRVIYELPKYTQLQLTNAGKQVDAPVNKHIVVFWNEGPGTVRDSDVRIPIQFRVQSPEKIIDAKIVRNSSATPDNFSLVSSRADGGEEGYLLRFKVMDPGDSVAVAFLSSGGDGGFDFIFRFGPKISIRQYDIRRDYLYFAAGAMITVILCCAGFYFLMMRILKLGIFGRKPQTQFIFQLAMWGVFVVTIIYCFDYALGAAVKYLKSNVPLPKIEAHSPKQ